MTKEASNSLLEALRARGVRLTPQRAIIFEVIEKLHDHITAEEIYQQVQVVSPYISLTTVYRTLELLQELGLVNQTNLGRGQAYFALKAHGPHHHLVCQECGRIDEFADALLISLRAELKQQYQFEACIDHMSIFGLCQACRKKGGQASNA
jgi:Fur family ferric uptake transcriptional regulator